VEFEGSHGGSSGRWALLRPYSGFRCSIVHKNPESVDFEVSFTFIPSELKETEPIPRILLFSIRIKTNKNKYAN
jgi:hypothetical protein